MALIRCPECGKERVSDTASNCPECGFNIMEYFQRKKDKENIDDKKIYVDDNSIIDFKNEFIYRRYKCCNRTKQRISRSIKIVLLFDCVFSLNKL